MAVKHNNIGFSLISYFFLMVAGAFSNVSVAQSVDTSIKPSRTECASPCTVVFSAEDTTAQGLDEHGVNRHATNQEKLVLFMSCEFFKD